MVSISNLQTVFGSTTETRAADKTAAQSASSGAAEISGSRDIDGDQRVVVSSTADALLQAAGGNDVRQEKVAQIQAAIAGGTYNVSSEAVADKMIAAMKGGQ